MEVVTKETIDLSTLEKVEVARITGECGSLSRTWYEGCVFINGDKVPYIAVEACVFHNCTFRSPVKIVDLAGSFCHNCNFSKLKVYIIDDYYDYGNKPKYICCGFLTKATELFYHTDWFSIDIDSYDGLYHMLSKTERLENLHIVIDPLLSSSQETTQKENENLYDSICHSVEELLNKDKINLKLTLCGKTVFDSTQQDC